MRRACRLLILGAARRSALARDCSASVAHAVQINRNRGQARSYSYGVDPADYSPIAAL
jgi:hypothetical protein